METRIIERTEQPSVILKELSHFQSEEILCDTTLSCSDGEAIRCHSCVLAAASERIQFLLKGVQCGDYTLQMDCVSSTTWQYIIRFIYDGRVILPSSEVERVKDAATRFQILPLIELLKTGDNLPKKYDSIAQSVSDCHRISDVIVLDDDDGCNTDLVTPFSKAHVENGQLNSVIVENKPSLVSDSVPITNTNIKCQHRHPDNIDVGKSPIGSLTIMSGFSDTKALSSASEALYVQDSSYKKDVCDKDLSSNDLMAVPTRSLQVTDVERQSVSNANVFQENLPIKNIGVRQSIISTFPQAFLNNSNSPHKLKTQCVPNTQIVDMGPLHHQTFSQTISNTQLLDTKMSSSNTDFKSDLPMPFNSESSVDNSLQGGEVRDARSRPYQTSQKPESGTYVMNSCKYGTDPLPKSSTLQSALPGFDIYRQFIVTKSARIAPQNVSVIRRGVVDVENEKSETRQSDREVILNHKASGDRNNDEESLLCISNVVSLAHLDSQSPVFSPKVLNAILSLHDKGSNNEPLTVTETAVSLAEQARLPLLETDSPASPDDLTADMACESGSNTKMRDVHFDNTEVASAELEHDIIGDNDLTTAAELPFSADKSVLGDQLLATHSTRGQISKSFFETDTRQPQLLSNLPKIRSTTTAPLPKQSELDQSRHLATSVDINSFKAVDVSPLNAESESGAKDIETGKGSCTETESSALPQDYERDQTKETEAVKTLKRKSPCDFYSNGTLPFKQSCSFKSGLEHYKKRRKYKYNSAAGSDEKQELTGILKENLQPEAMEVLDNCLPNPPEDSDRIMMTLNQHSVEAYSQNANNAREKNMMDTITGKGNRLKKCGTISKPPAEACSVVSAVSEIVGTVSLEQEADSTTDNSIAEEASQKVNADPSNVEDEDVENQKSLRVVESKKPNDVSPGPSKKEDLVVKTLCGRKVYKASQLHSRKKGNADLGTSLNKGKSYPESDFLGIQFVGKRIKHEWVITTNPKTTKWFTGKVLRVVKGKDGDYMSQYEVQYDGDDTYLIDHLLEDYMDSSLFIV